MPNILREHWKDFHMRVKPILNTLKEEYKKNLEQGILLHGLTELINSNTENMTKVINSNTQSMTSLMTAKKSEANASSSPFTNDAGTVRVTKLT